MSEIIIYRCQWTNNEGKLMEVGIQDLKNYIPGDVATVQYKELTGGANPFTVECYDLGVSEIFGYGIMGKQATFSFKSTNEISISTFSKGDDRRFLMKAVFDGGNYIPFIGYVIMDGNSEGYVPPGQDVFIRATCGLGTLNGAELRELNGLLIDADTPKTKIAWLCRALQATGLELRINVVDNLYNEVMATRAADVKNSPWAQCWQLPSTYEKEVNEYVDCKEVVKELLNGVARISQYNGDWWLIRNNELKNYSSGISYTQFLPNGSVQAGVTGYTGNLVEIGRGDIRDRYFIDRATTVEVLRPNKSAMAEFDFVSPPELPRNKDFIRGDHSAIMSTVDYDAYFAFDWQNGRDSGGGAPITFIFIRRLFENGTYLTGYEKERWLQINKSSPNDHWIMSKKIYLNKLDKFRFGIDRKLSAQPGGAGNYTDIVAKIRLYADDGTFYTLHGGTTTAPTIKWVACTSAFNTNQQLIQIQGNLNTDDLREWKTKSFEAAPLPKTGYIRIQLYQSAIAGTTADTHLFNLQWEHIPYINGSYKKYKGEKITNTNKTGNLSAKQEFKLSHNESSHVIFQGALLNYDAGADKITVLSQNWKDMNLAPLGLPYKEFDKFLKHASLDFYNHYRTERRKFDFTIKHLLTPGGFADIHCVFMNNVVSEHNTDKTFLCTSMVQDWNKCTMSGTMIQLFDANDQWGDVGEFDSVHRFIEN